MWVWLSGWMIADGEPALPVSGDILRDVGLRLTGWARQPRYGVEDGVIELSNNGNHPYLYRCTGGIEGVQDVYTHERKKARQVGCEFFLSVGDRRLQVHTANRAAEFERGTRLTVTGEVALIGQYEWTAGFPISDTRSDWLVSRVVKDVEADDALLQLSAI